MHPLIKQDMEDIYSRRTDWDTFDGKTMLLTGAYGMLASYLVYFLFYLKEEKNINVKLMVVVRNKNKFYKKFRDLDGIDGCTVIESDLSQKLEISTAVDYIIHAASLASPQYYSVCPVDVLQPNTIGNYNLLQLAKEKQVKGYLLFSTGDVYGAVNVESGLIGEETFGAMNTLDIHNCYSESKRMAETMCKAFQVQYNVPTKMVRIAHTYAPTMDIENDPRVFASFVKNIVNRQDIVMKSSGAGKRSFCYITDAVAGYFTVLLDGKDGDAYNVCNTDQYVSIRQLAECLANLYPDRHIHVIQKERSAEEHYTENVLLLGSESTPDNAKLKTLGWEAKVSIEDGFNRVVRYLESEK